MNAELYSLCINLQYLVANEKGRRLCCGTDSELNTPLHIAAKRGNEDALKVSIQCSYIGDHSNLGVATV